MTEFLIFLGIFLMIVISIFIRTIFHLKKNTSVKNDLLIAELNKIKNKQKTINEKIFLQEEFKNNYQKNMKMIDLEWMNFENKIYKIIFRD